MTTLSLSALRDNADHLATLAGVFQTNPADLKAQAIRKADKSLVALEALFSAELIQSASQWLKARESKAVLQKRLESLVNLKKEIESYESKVTALKDQMIKWSEMGSSDKNDILQKAAIAKQYLHNKNEIAEAHILHKFRRFNALKNLVPYSDNVDLLCESIHHYQNREKYEENIQKLHAKIDQGQVRLHSVKRGFVLAIIFCIFLVTIPLCGPFAYSLWVRRREIELQISNSQESLRREERRLEAADEGVIAQQEIKTILGDLPLEQIRNILNEVRDLRAEFNAHIGAQTNPTVQLLMFLETYQEKIVAVFGAIPLDPIEAFRWLVSVTEDTQQNENKLASLESELNVIQSKLKSLTKGHSQQILQDALNRLADIEVSSFLVPFEESLKIDFAKVIQSCQNTLHSARELLWMICNGQSVDLHYWSQVQTNIESMSNTFNACVLSAEIDKNWKEHTDTAATLK